MSRTTRWLRSNRGLPVIGLAVLVAVLVPLFATVNTVSAQAAAGVTIVESSGSTDGTEGGATDTYTVVLDAVPSGPFCIRSDSSSHQAGSHRWKMLEY